MRWLLGVVSLVVVLAPEARADSGERNYLIGPLLGIRLGGEPGNRAVIGFEGGVGYGPERINVGYEHRAGKGFAYIELDPWLYLGASLGVGVDTDGDPHPVLGLWEGIPLILEECTDELESAATLAVGYRFTGVHELYVTIKAGVAQSGLCFH